MPAVAMPINPPCGIVNEVPPSAVLTCACALQAIPGISYDRSSGYWKVVGGCANVN